MSKITNSIWLKMINLTLNVRARRPFMNIVTTGFVLTLYKIMLSVLTNVPLLSLTETAAEDL